MKNYRIELDGSFHDARRVPSGYASSTVGRFYRLTRTEAETVAEWCRENGRFPDEKELESLVPGYHDPRGSHQYC
jgi:hypothetical protein